MINELKGLLVLAVFSKKMEITSTKVQNSAIARMVLSLYLPTPENHDRDAAIFVIVLFKMAIPKQE